MPESPAHNQPANFVAGGTSPTPTPANNVGGGTGWGDKGFLKGGTASDDDEPRQGFGHVDVRIPNSFSLRAKLTQLSASSPPTHEERWVKPSVYSNKRPAPSITI